MSKTLSRLLFFASGVLAGTAVGILFAPEAGSSTRDKISFQLSRTKDRLSDFIDKLREADSSQGMEARSQSERIIKETEEEAKRLLDDVEALMQQIKSQNKG